MAAAVGMMIGSAVANAVAFIGGNAIYGLVSKQGASEEVERHNRAMEELQRASTEWSQRRLARLDYLNEQLHREQHADKVYRDVNEAMRLYHEVTGGDEQKLKNVPYVEDEPSLSNYYKPSEEQQKYELIFLAGGISLSAWLAFNYL